MLPAISSNDITHHVDYGGISAGGRYPVNGEEHVKLREAIAGCLAWVA